jgi:hypothetical protein
MHFPASAMALVCLGKLAVTTLGNYQKIVMHLTLRLEEAYIFFITLIYFMVDLAPMLLLLVQQVRSMVELSILLAFLNFNLQTSQPMSSYKNPQHKMQKANKEKTQKQATRMALPSCNHIFGVTWGVESWSSYNPCQGHTDFYVFSIWLIGYSRTITIDIILY